MAGKTSTNYFSIPQGHLLRRKQILKALPKWRGRHSDKLRAAFEKHHSETEGQVERLEQIFELLASRARQEVRCHRGHSR